MTAVRVCACTLRCCWLCPRRDVNPALNYAEAVHDECRVGQCSVSRRICPCAMKIGKRGGLIDKYRACQID